MTARRVAGLGFRAGAGEASLEMALRAALAAARAVPDPIPAALAGRVIHPTRPAPPPPHTSRASDSVHDRRCPHTATGPRPLDALATAARKADSPALQALAARWGLPVIALPDDRLAAQTTPTESARVRAVTGTGSLAEAAALAAAGPGARLLAPRALSPDGQATAAIAHLAPERPTLPPRPTAPGPAAPSSATGPTPASPSGVP